MAELKPCPFCGGEAELVDYGLNARYKGVTCGECGARTRFFSPEIGIGGEFAAIEAWNRRAKSETD